MPDKSVYDERYSGAYRTRLHGFDIARREALNHFITQVIKIKSAEKVLDYGAGSGLYVELWEKVFPDAELFFCDISAAAMEKFKAKYPRYVDRYILIRDDRANFNDDDFDVIVSVEVMEHVDSLDAYLGDIRRLLKRGARFVWTTPCANAISIEHIFSTITRNIEPTAEGYRRWKWEDPTHLRRLKSQEIEELLTNLGFSEIRFRFRAHFFSFVCTYFPTQHLKGLRDRLMRLDYALFRCLPNGASMVGAATKTAP